MDLKPLNQVFDPRLKLPGDNGKTYYIPEPDAELGLYCTAAFAAGVTVSQGGELTGEMPPLQLDDDDELALYRRILGPVHHELEADGYGFSTQRFFGQVAFFWIAAGEAVAEAFWNAGGDPKASGPRATRRATARKAQPTGSTRSTAGASTTRKAASTSGTTPRKAPSKAPAASRSRGK